METPIDGQKPVEPQNTVVETIDIGNGNMVNKEQITAMKTKADGLEQGVVQLFGVAQDWKDKHTASTTDTGTANAARLQAELARDSALARTVELEGQLKNYIAPETYKELKDQHDLTILENVGGRMKALAAIMKVPVENLNGKTLEQITALEEAATLMVPKQNVDPKLDGGAGGGGPVTTGKSMWDNSHQANKDQIQKLKDKSAGKGSGVNNGG